jgi:hypothetical protein
MYTMFFIEAVRFAQYRKFITIVPADAFNKWDELNRVSTGMKNKRVVAALTNSQFKLVY